MVPGAGNLCRHSAFFYRYLDHHDFLTPVIKCCGDSDSATRKFACFAFGNAAFHDGTLYKKLAQGIPKLVAALYDKENKTRVNAAGALGNLARNGDAVVPDMIKAGAVKVLFYETPNHPTLCLQALSVQFFQHVMIMCGLVQEMIEVATIREQDPNLQSVALFSLGNMANFPAMCSEMRAAECQARMAPLLESKIPDVQKNCDRLMKKLNSQQQPRRPAPGQ